MDPFLALRIRALGNVLQPDNAFRIRRVFRWYSHRFHTPLHLVEELPTDAVLQTYYEWLYDEHMDHDDVIDEARELLKSEEERLADLFEQGREAASDERFIAETQKLLTEEQNKEQNPISRPMQPLPSIVPPIEPAIKMQFDTNLDDDDGDFVTRMQPPKKR